MHLRFDWETHQFILFEHNSCHNGRSAFPRGMLSTADYKLYNTHRHNVIRICSHLQCDFQNRGRRIFSRFYLLFMPFRTWCLVSSPRSSLRGMKYSCENNDQFMIGNQKYTFLCANKQKDNLILHTLLSPSGFYSQ